MNRKKILILTPRYPYPVVGGDRLRIYEICRKLSKEYDLTLLTLCETRDEMHHPFPDDGVFIEIHKVYLPKLYSYINCLLSLPTKTPLQIAYYHSYKFEKLINKLAKNHDLIFSHLIRVSEYAKNLPNKKILEMTDAISMNYERFCQTKNKSGIKGLIYG
nr:glycosyl transferase family 1 [Photorhabdus aegyptia]